MEPAELPTARAERASAARDRWRDLAVILLGEGLLLVLVAFDAPVWFLQLPRIILGLAGTLFAPGYALVAALFPRADDLDGPERLAASFGLSWAVIPPLALLLDRLPWGLRLWPMVIALATVTVVCAAVAGYRRSKRPGGEQPDRPGRSGLRAWWASQSLTQRIGAGALAALFVALTVSVLALIVLPSHGGSVTEFYLLGPQGRAEDYPREARVGQPVTVTVGIANHEANRTVFRIEALEDERLIGQAGPALVEPGAVEERPIHFTPANPGDDETVTFVLYRGDEHTPYRTLRLWLKVKR